VTVLVEEPHRAPSVPATDKVSVEKPQSLVGRSPLAGLGDPIIRGFQNFAGDRGVGGDGQSDNKKIAAGREAAAA
jgi:hypothetical protein